MRLVRAERVGVFLVGLSRRMVFNPSPEMVAFLRDSSCRMAVQTGRERVAFLRDLSRHRSEIDLPGRKVALLAAVLGEVDLAVGI